MKILFISPWTKTLYGDEKAIPGHPHIGIAYLTAVLKENNHQVKIFDQAIENDDQKLTDLIKKFKPDVIGITAFSYCYAYVSDLIKKVKSITKIPLIMGGPHVSAVKKDSLEKTQADFAMKNEAENSFIIFLNEFKKKKPRFKTVPNLIWRDKNGNVIENPDASFIVDLDKIPFPDYSEFHFEKYSYFSSKTIPIITSRGCPYNCNYCSVRLSMGRGFRPRSPKNILLEIEHWYKKGFRTFEINDDCFTLDLKRAEEICDLIIKKKLNITYNLYNGIRVDRVSKKLLKKMKQSGCVFISFGVESGNQGIINQIGKNITLKQTRRAIKLTNEVGIANSANFIIGHPGETYKTAMQTIKFAEELPTNFVNFYNLIPYPGTALYEWVEKNANWIYHPDYALKKIGARDLKPVFETDEFTEEERMDVLKKGFSLYEKTILRFRFGKIFGMFFYFLSKNRKLFNFGLKAALGSKLGFRVYSLLTGRNKK